MTVGRRKDYPCKVCGLENMEACNLKSSLDPRYCIDCMRDLNALPEDVDPDGDYLRHKPGTYEFDQALPLELQRVAEHFGLDPERLAMFLQKRLGDPKWTQQAGLWGRQEYP